ncbi:hypothetical protein Emin_0082 [Elusimicrobium minutum Pei191]|uniref:GYF domain-containing protein n=1 Tax=Elusimicrobium minutum (strain Pei191) TaxID=445932 RepID=B2KAV2_ELUMP|nr:hypothetical protein [Elusimicrobium minutum]ACC97648.1 hypothetical protein Emin_0082 [Elusimicrobium minutum Pei191]
MRYWILEKGDVIGPFEAEELKKREDFSLANLVCPESHGDDHTHWREASFYADFTPQDSKPKAQNTDKPQTVTPPPKQETKKEENPLSIEEYFDKIYHTESHELSNVLGIPDNLENSDLYLDRLLKKELGKEKRSANKEKSFGAKGKILSANEKEQVKEEKKQDRKTTPAPPLTTREKATHNETKEQKADIPLIPALKEPSAKEETKVNSSLSASAQPAEQKNIPPKKEEIKETPPSAIKEKKPLQPQIPVIKEPAPTQKKEELVKIETKKEPAPAATKQSKEASQPEIKKETETPVVKQDNPVSKDNIRPGAPQQKKESPKKPGQPEEKKEITPATAKQENLPVISEAQPAPIKEDFLQPDILKIIEEEEKTLPQQESLKEAPVLKQESHVEGQPLIEPIKTVRPEDASEEEENPVAFGVQRKHIPADSFVEHKKERSAIDPRTKKESVKPVILTAGTIFILLTVGLFILLSQAKKSSEQQFKAAPLPVKQERPELIKTDPQPKMPAQKVQKAPAAPAPLPPPPAKAAVDLTVQERAVDIAKNHMLKKKGMSIDGFLNSYFEEYVKQGYTASWSAEPLHKDIYIVKYRLVKPRKEPVIYIFEVDTKKNIVSGALNNWSLDLLDMQ